MVIMETTNDVFNETLYRNYINSNTVSEWVRVMVSNVLGVNGRTWAGNFSLYNSGTYNNQWQIVDYKLFVPGQNLTPGTLTILEQVPGFVVSADKTDVLQQQSYWPSYNIPYFPFIFNISGYNDYYKKFGNSYSYDHCARANIFRRDQHTVQDMSSLKKIMRYNKYQTDPLSLKDACKGVSSRCDLNTPWISNITLNGFDAFGGIDAKATNNVLLKNYISSSVNGPTWDSQPPFAWNSQWEGVAHYGQPTVFDFDWIDIYPM